METFNFNSLNLKKIKTAIDVGCGNGRHLKSLGFRLSNSEIIGIDQSELEINALNVPDVKPRPYIKQTPFSDVFQQI